ncbi:MAG TPA: hypothetical protein DEG17_22705 [Cyanobacteria bacterium UBA11149]|nr:hypothetical protein [Cyanobacteria bacterium UBA11367]HBE60974.1 hypothetical protein [Cyanobacteria bacterium UBA11366]HBR77152.1 hypothetical protein [Cyanobacteria bacterium UBA11159]HBS71384.1 hypothetical protein [Cyanobacteria bacterium UBA11153]HBW91593.1 hypothetical protein [Cyanobacteria bacterium UBA11149]HCA95528.1 hypothetical protein [Cyanobacteria bacterium UBA9226]
MGFLNPFSRSKLIGQLIMMVLLGVYLSVACKLLHTWLKAFQQTPDLAKDQKYLCGIVFAIATVFWPIIIPISYLEKCAKRQEELNKVSINQIQNHLVCDLHR